MALSDCQPAEVIGANSNSRDRPGFEVELLSRHSIGDESYTINRHEILMPVMPVCVCRQKEAVIDIVSDGEWSMISYATYVKDRYKGFGGDKPTQCLC